MKNQEYIYGFHSVKGILQSKHSSGVTKIYLLQASENARRREILELARKNKITVEFLPRSALDGMTAFATHQGVVALCERREKAGIEMQSGSANTVKDIKELLDRFGNKIFLLILDGIQDPRNLGACLRTANAAGVHVVIVPKDNAVGLTDVVHKVASGATAVTPVFQVTNLARTMRELKDNGVWLYGATLEEGAENLFAMKFQRPLAIVLGAEGRGMRRLTHDLCDFLFTIPMFGSVQSLNVAVATGICLFEAARTI